MTFIAKARKKSDFDGVNGKDRCTDTPDGLRIEVRQGEFTGADAPTRNRCELVLSDKKTNRHWPSEGDDWWYKLEFLIPASTPLPAKGTTNYMMLMQHIIEYRRDRTGSKIFDNVGSLEIRDDKALGGSGNPGPGIVELSYGSCASGGEPVVNGKIVHGKFWAVDIAKVTRDKWHTLILHKKWSSDPKVGYVELIWNGVQQLLGQYGSRTEKRLYHANLRPDYTAYLKHGLYRSDKIGGTGVLLTKGVDIATSKAEIDGGAPTEPPAPTPVPAVMWITCPKCGQAYHS